MENTSRTFHKPSKVRKTQVTISFIYLCINILLYLFFRIGITVTDSLLEAINTTKLIEDENLKHWLFTVSTSSPGQTVKAPNGLIKTLTSISVHGPTGIL